MKLSQPRAIRRGDCLKIQLHRVKQSRQTDCLFLDRWDLFFISSQMGRTDRQKPLKRTSLIDNAGHLAAKAAMVCRLL
jgi:hypothetical protein